MKLTVERLPESQVRLDIVADEAEFASAVEKAARKVARDVQIPGFRKGKVPRSMIERMYGREVFLEEAHKLIMDDLYRKALLQEELVPVGPPEVEVTEPDPIAFSVVVSVYPTVDPGDYAAVRVEPGDAAVVEEQIDKVVDRLLKTSSPWVDPAEPRTPREGDQITLDLSMVDPDGEDFQDAIEDAVFVLGESNLFPQLRELAETLDVGGTGTTTITFAEDDEDATERLRGQTLTYTATLKGLKEREPLEVDDEFARSYAGEDSVEAMRLAIAKDLHEGRTTEVRGEVVNAITDRIADQATADVPSEMVDEAVDEEIGRVRQRLQMQRTSLESYLRANDQTEEELREELRPAVAKRLRNSLILRAIADREGVAVEEAEIDAQVEDIVAGAPNEEQLRKVYSGDRYMRTVLRNDLFDQRLTDRLIEIATEGRGAVLNAYDASLYPEPELVDAMTEEDAGDASPDGDAGDASPGDDAPAGDASGAEAAGSGMATEEVEQLDLGDDLAPADAEPPTGATGGSAEPMETLATIAAADDEPLEDDLPETAAESASPGTDADQLPPATAEDAGAETTPFPPSVAPDGEACPDDHPIKGNAGSRIYHVAGQVSYAATIPEICFATAEDAEAVGYRASLALPIETDEAE